ncbi:hypothetical protein J7T55_006138 [Diaporthe amygdali]|uniref:uncharacterized protein n=1 Tax=Phomopsis amygdali TaxID=1214568 RepID=UPI0022FEA804|nr:uncharacterized protein J7T55_006138 [Diaporthe amygdali]KAJ0124797.1 hypothetical protein J7T55_006138 [Diaporthe amygdali]
MDASGIRPAKAEHFDILHLANQIIEYHDEIVYWAQETAHHILRSISPALNVAEPHSMDDAAFGSRPSALRADADEAQTSTAKRRTHYHMEISTTAVADWATPPTVKKERFTVHWCFTNAGHSQQTDFRFNARQIQGKHIRAEQTGRVALNGFGGNPRLVFI